MKVTIEIPNPPSEQKIIEIPIHFFCGQVVDAGRYGFEEHTTGKWIPARPLPMEADSYKHKRYWKCSVCGGHDFFNPQYGEKIKFCRYCGKELEVDECQ